jgi:hypothetical protein
MCNNLIISTAVSVVDNQLVINIPATTLVNREKIYLLIAQALPTSAGTLPTIITDGSIILSVLRPCGNYVRADQLRTRTKYVLTIATTPPVAMLRNTECLTCTAYVQPQLVPASTSQE